MLYLKWFILSLLDILLLVTLPFVPPVIAMFTKAQPHGLPQYTWGGWWGTYDNPPQGDEGFVKKRSLYPTITTGWKGYVNRVHWMVRNNMYGYARLVALDYSEDCVQHVLGQDGISDKDKVPGWYFVRLYHLKTKKLVGFEFYGVFPYASSRDVRIRLGWKILTSKFKTLGFAPLVNTFNPFDGYGDA